MKTETVPREGRTVRATVAESMGILGKVVLEDRRVFEDVKVLRQTLITCLITEDVPMERKVQRGCWDGQTSSIL